MKKLMMIIFASLVISTSANAAWYAKAESPSAWGKGYANTLVEAKQIALYECAKRTPYYQTCFITDYYWY